jgi:hypothetical protein
MDKLFVGIVAVALLAILATPVFADTFPVEAGPGNLPPEIYLLDSKYDICCPAGNGGSRPYIPDPVTGKQDAQFDGCLIDLGKVRADEYAFTGEQIYFRVAVRDLNGAQDIGYAFFTVDGMNEALCTEVTGTDGFTQGAYKNQIPAKPFTPAGINLPTDKVFNCILTVEPSWYGDSMINIKAMDLKGTVSDNGIAQTWFFNPAIMLELKTNDGAPSVEFEDGYPGQTVMSTNKLMIENLAEGGVDLWAFIAADDLTDPSHSAAMCPVSNVLDIEGLTYNGGIKYGMEFRCKIGAIEDDYWHWMTNKDTSRDCGSVNGGCLGAQAILNIAPNYNIIKNQASAECQFRLTYPVPCIGDFTEGAFHVIVRAL